MPTRTTDLEGEPKQLFVSPTNGSGPFTDSSRPLLDKLPEGVKGGQQIGPAAFHDPKTGKYYLYWGNGYMAGAELNDDLVSLKLGTTRVLKPDPTFREGAYAFSVIQVPGRDEWYLVYHRFTYPQGITMKGPGFHREVCLDKLEFNPDGSIRPVVPTQAGIAPVKLP